MRTNEHMDIDILWSTNASTCKQVFMCEPHMDRTWTHAFLTFRHLCRSHEKVPTRQCPRQARFRPCLQRGWGRRRYNQQGSHKPPLRMLLTDTPPYIFRFTLIDAAYLAPDKHRIQRQYSLGATPKTDCGSDQTYISITPTGTHVWIV